MEGKGDLWHQLAHVLEPWDEDDLVERFSPELIEQVDRLEEFFSTFAERWRRGADKEISDLLMHNTDKLAGLRTDYTKLEELYKKLHADHEAATAALVNVREKVVTIVSGAKAEIAELKEVISDLHSVLNREEWDQLEDKTKELALKIHEELWHGDEG